MVGTISYFMLEARDSLAVLADQSWFNDGLNDGEAAFLTTLGATHRISPGLFDDFVETRYTRAGTVELPLAGTVRLWAFQNTPFLPGEDVIGPMKESVRHIEGYMGVPFPADRVIMVSVVRPPGSHYDIGAGQHGSGHIHVVRVESGPLRQRLLRHELAHYYYTFFPIWLTEGGAEFMSSVVQHRRSATCNTNTCPTPPFTSTPWGHRGRSTTNAPRTITRKTRPFIIPIMAMTALVARTVRIGKPIRSQGTRPTQS